MLFHCCWKTSTSLKKIKGFLILVSLLHGHVVWAVLAWGVTCWATPAATLGYKNSIESWLEYVSMQPLCPDGTCDHCWDCCNQFLFWWWLGWCWSSLLEDTCQCHLILRDCTLVYVLFSCFPWVFWRPLHLSCHLPFSRRFRRIFASRVSSNRNVKAIKTLL